MEGWRNDHGQTTINNSWFCGATWFVGNKTWSLIESQFGTKEACKRSQQPVASTELGSCAKSPYTKLSPPPQCDPSPVTSLTESRTRATVYPQREKALHNDSSSEWGNLREAIRLGKTSVVSSPSTGEPHVRDGCVEVAAKDGIPGPQTGVTRQPASAPSPALPIGGVVQLDQGSALGWGYTRHSRHTRGRWRGRGRGRRRERGCWGRRHRASTRGAPGLTLEDVAVESAVRQAIGRHKQHDDLGAE